MSDTATKNNPTVLEEFLREFRLVWTQIPNKALFLGLLGLWCALFHFLGNPTLGYVKSKSMFSWMYFSFSTNEDDEHGLIIPLIVLALCWWKREQLRPLTARVWWPAMTMVLLGLTIHVLGFLIQQTRVSIVGFFVGLYGLIGLTWGWPVMKAIFFPYFLFGFCVPLGTVADTLTFPLRLFATSATDVVARGLLGIEVVKEGTTLMDADHRFQYEIVAACSGLRSLTATLALTTIYGFVMFQAPWKKVVLMLSGFPLALVYNLCRLLSIIIAADAFGQNAGNYVHEKLGLLPYVPVIACLLALSFLLREQRAPAATNLAATPA
ncbi:MAG: exosortase/archaeosortase family protein [Verrucomicrobia bacterium]|nr:exosortase/archaeosortase family protein [Verrucomicrobiota bacterium]